MYVCFLGTMTTGHKETVTGTLKNNRHLERNVGKHPT